MSFRITLRAGSDSFFASPEETLLEAALKQGRQLPYGCRNGECGACKTRIVTGRIHYEGCAAFAALTDVERQAGWALACQAHAASDLTIEVREVDRTQPQEVRTLPARVAHLKRLSPDVLGIWLQLPKSERLAFRAGQYIEILMRDGRQRAYSLANAPHDDELLELHVRYYPGGAFAEYAFNVLHEKELLRIRGPYGTFVLQEESTRPLVFVAGGTGFAPSKAIIEHAFARGVKQPMRLYWGVRAVHDIYSTLPQQWSQAYPNFTFVPVLSEPAADDDWSGRRGFVHEALLDDLADLGNVDVYTSGPPVMVNAVAEVCLHRGLPLDRIHSDAFEFAPK